MSYPSTTKLTIFLAEDDEDDYLLFRDAIEEERNEIRLRWVKDGEELMKALLEKNAMIPDLLFLDINMPRKNGFECLAEIRKTESLAHLPVIIFSTSSDRALVNWMYNAGANLYFSKPTDFTRLKENIRTVMAMDWNVHRPYPRTEDFVLGDR